MKRDQPRRKKEQFFVVFGFGWGFAPWVRILSSTSRLYDENKRENWERVASAANVTADEYLAFASLDGIPRIYRQKK